MGCWPLLPSNMKLVFRGVCTSALGLWRMLGGASSILLLPSCLLMQVLSTNVSLPLISAQLKKQLVGEINFSEMLTVGGKGRNVQIFELQTIILEATVTQCGSPQTLEPAART